jgi:hypothetical protein
VPLHAVAVRGTGRATVPAYGLADAEHRVEKELGERLPDAVVAIGSVERPPVGPKIVEEFLVQYSVRLKVEVEAPDVAAARSAAFRSVRGRLEGSRYARTAWEAPR